MFDSLSEKIDSVKALANDAYTKAANEINKATLAPRDASLTKTKNKFNANKYAVEQHSYPSDLMSEVYGGNYAVFYINVSVDSRLNVKSNTVELDPNIEPRLRGSLVAKNMDVGTLVGAMSGAQFLGGLSGGVSKEKAADAAVDAGATAIGVAVAGSLAPDASRSQRRLKTAIALHIPNQLSVRYGMQWSEQDTAAVQGVADALQAGLSKQGAVNRLGSIGREGAASFALQKMPGAASAALGIASNPKMEQTFRGVDFRKFTFEYQFFPRDVVEAQNVLNIIEQFKLHMHPEFKSELNYVYIYPSEFDIMYYTGGVENTNLHKHTSCVLEEMNVNYTPNGAFSVFPNGMPTQINVSLGFKELQLLSKETVEGGL